MSGCVYKDNIEKANNKKNQKRDIINAKAEIERP